MHPDVQALPRRLDMRRATAVLWTAREKCESRLSLCQRAVAHLLDDLEHVRLQVVCAVCSDAQVELVGAVARPEGVRDTENGVRGCHLDASHLGGPCRDHARAHDRLKEPNLLHSTAGIRACTLGVRLTSFCIAFQSAACGLESVPAVP